MTEPDIAHAVKEIFGHQSPTFSPVDKRKKRLFDRPDPRTSRFLEFTFQKIQLSVKTLGADISSVTFPEFFTEVKQNPR